MGFPELGRYGREAPLWIGWRCHLLPLVCFCLNRNTLMIVYLSQSWMQSICSSFSCIPVPVSLYISLLVSQLWLCRETTKRKDYFLVSGYSYRPQAHYLAFPIMGCLLSGNWVGTCSLCPLWSAWRPSRAVGKWSHCIDLSLVSSHP